MHHQPFALSLVLACFLIGPAIGETPAESTLGAQAPEWKGLMGTDGKTHASSELNDAKATLVVFLCNQCPCAKGYEERIIDFAKGFGDRGVRVVAFNSNLGDGESLEKMKERAGESEFNFAYLKDSTQDIGRAFAAKTTPHVFLLDQKRKIVFSGAFDNDMRGKKITETYVADAIDDLLDNRPVKVNESRLCGCSISYQ